ncbi:helical backbone metal receptor [Mucilaginibacter psychrotolerans]|uniref:Cobalamin-binding protein n=1 Tax=Mucilaginibacter psychrotolerans TaxID=1524096 RepID=A0A4Y8S8T6_9SPHI|nr:helical backbone metal receptor [Mucilaginibacter psychrotolerans]TFF35513.1 cobalamin-binding protein [Mucilaginibacter psychrotolerans]
MPVFHDQLGRSVTILQPPKRIISIVPSQTELLFFLGLEAEVAGVTKFCVHPAGKVNGKIKVGGTKQLDLEAIYALKPDLIIANKEENEQRQVEVLMAQYPVWVSDINDLPSALQMISGVGQITGRAKEAALLTDKIRQEFVALVRPVTTFISAYFIWRKPYMVAGSGTFIDSMLLYCGFTNVFALPRYPQVTNQELIAAAPQLVLLSSEPYPFAQKHVEEIQALLPNAKIILVDGEMFSWYGSRLLQAPTYFKALLETFS